MRVAGTKAQRPRILHRPPPPLHGDLSVVHTRQRRGLRPDTLTYNAPLGGLQRMASLGVVGRGMMGGITGGMMGGDWKAGQFPGGSACREGIGC